VRIDWHKAAASGLAGVRRNVLPGLALQVFALALVLLYYFSPSARPWFETVAGWKTQFGFGYSALSTALFGGLIPFLYLWVSGSIRQGRWRAELLFYLLLWGYRGVEVDLFYRLQSHMFGDGAALAIVIPKVLVDQFGYSVFIAAPGQVVCFLWKDRDFSFAAIKPDLTFATLTSAVVAVLFSQWMVWIPAVSIIYCLPSALQIPLFNLVVCFWVLLLTFVSQRSAALGSKPASFGADGRATPTAESPR
jgi:hypothetical protein